MSDDSEVKKAKGTKKCIIKPELMFKNYKDRLFNGEVILTLFRMGIFGAAHG